MRFVEQIDRQQTPDEIIHLLHDSAARVIKINVLSAWRMPHEPGNWYSIALDKDIFPHSSMNRQYWIDLLDLIKQHGYADMEQHAQRHCLPFTFTEAMRENKPVGSARWIYDLTKKYGMRDGFVVPLGDWRVAYWSPHVLRLSSRERLALIGMSVITIMHLTELICPGAERKRPPRGYASALSPQELSTVRLLALGKTTDQVAEDLGVKVTTVRTYRQRAQEKLHALTDEHTIAVAMRRGLVR